MRCVRSASSTTTRHLSVSVFIADVSIASACFPRRACTKPAHTCRRVFAQFRLNAISFSGHAFITKDSIVTKPVPLSPHRLAAPADRGVCHRRHAEAAEAAAAAVEASRRRWRRRRGKRVAAAPATAVGARGGFRGNSGGQAAPAVECTGPASRQAGGEQAGGDGWPALQVYEAACTTEILTGTWSCFDAAVPSRMFSATRDSIVERRNAAPQFCNVTVKLVSKEKTSSLHPTDVPHRDECALEQWQAEHVYRSGLAMVLQEHNVVSAAAS